MKAFGRGWATIAVPLGLDACAPPPYAVGRGSGGEDPAPGRPQAVAGTRRLPAPLPLRSAESGFALLAALWLTVALSIVAAGSLAIGREGLSLSSTRLAMNRGYWAAEACHAILDARYAADPTVRKVDSIDLGHEVWCTAVLTEPASRLNLNTATPAQLRLVLGADSLVAALLDWTDPDTVTRPQGAESPWYRAHGRPEPSNRPLADPQELSLIRGFDSATVDRLLPLVTTTGDGHIALATAPAAVLATLPGVGPEALDVITAHHSMGRPLGSLDEVSQALSPSSRAQLSGAWAELQQSTSTSASLFEAAFTGGVRGHAAVTEVRDLLVPDGVRLAVVRRIVP